MMAQYTNSTPNSNNWNLYFRPFPYSEGLVVLLILLYGLKTQLQNPNYRRNVKLIQKFQRKMVHLLNTLMNWCAYMQDFDDTHLGKHIINVKVIPYENKTIVKPEKKKTNIPGILLKKSYWSKNKLPWLSNGLYFPWKH